MIQLKFAVVEICVEKFYLTQPIIKRTEIEKFQSWFKTITIVFQQRDTFGGLLKWLKEWIKH